MIKSLSLINLVFSRPDEISIMLALVILIASLILSSVNPPAKNHGFVKLKLPIIDQSKLCPLPDLAPSSKK